MLHQYETVLVTIPDIQEDALKSVKSKIEGSISKHEGEVAKLDDWGVKRLAYEINHSKKGRYFCYFYKAKPEVVQDIERNLRIDERVIRFLTLRIEEKKEKLTKKEKRAKKAS